MSTLWQARYVMAAVLGFAYVALPKRIHTFGFEFLRRSSSNRSEGTDTPVWLYRGLGVLLLFIGVTGVF
ncbi:hypothetical protein BRD22_04965 [Halobacteriales archaeon SW_8_68_21]|nr:MAG: hypothetical protein BRD22_04965 [Halobacteriales archaeon SW_8_68_21]